MTHVSVESLKKAGFENPEQVFIDIAIAGGFGAVGPDHGGGLDISGLEGKAKTDVDKILGKKADKDAR